MTSSAPITAHLDVVLQLAHHERQAALRQQRHVPGTAAFTHLASEEIFFCRLRYFSSDLDDALPGGVFSRTIKLMLERQKSSIYQHVMLFECAKITPYQQDMSH